MNISILQSKEWQKLQEDFKKETFFESETDYQFLAIIENTPVGKYLYCPYGPAAENKTGFKKALKSLEAIAKSNDALFIRIEPQNPAFIASLPKNAKKAKEINPKNTWVIDLDDETDLKQKLPSRLFRYYKNYEKSGLTIETSKDSEDIKHLLKLQAALAKQKHINTFSESYLQTELSQPFATLYLMKDQQSEIIAAGMVFDHQETRYNLQGAQSETGRKNHATGILTIKLILDAKEKGLKYFDFWGIAPTGAKKNHPWAGFTDFKKTFGGREVDYAGAYHIILKKPKYLLYNVLRKANLMIRKLKP